MLALLDKASCCVEFAALHSGYTVRSYCIILMLPVDQAHFDTLNCHCHSTLVFLDKTSCCMEFPALLSGHTARSFCIILMLPIDQALFDNGH